MELCEAKEIPKNGQILLGITDLPGLKVYLFPRKLKDIITCLKLPIQTMFLLHFKSSVPINQLNQFGEKFIKAFFLIRNGN